MEILKNVSVEKKANVYFEGKVTSRNIFLKNGTKQSLGIMLPGQGALFLRIALFHFSEIYYDL